MSNLTGDDEFKNVIADTLARHNFYRKRHNAAPLQINSKLNELSQNWANELAQKDAALHRSNNAYGENIFIIMSPQKVTDLGTRAVDYWYSEISFFDFYGTNEDMDAAVKAFHFTQVIWKDSKELGVGVSKSPKSGKIYLVCNYDPRGNVISKFKDNVLPAKS